MESYLLRVKEAAELLGVAVITLKRWDKSGKLKSLRINERGDRRYRRIDIQNFATQIEKQNKSNGWL